MSPRRSLLRFIGKMYRYKSKKAFFIRIFSSGGMLENWIHASTNSRLMAAANFSNRDIRFFFWGDFAPLGNGVALALLLDPGVVCSNSADMCLPVPR